jgi:GAG-pre-integrase domain
MTLESCVVMNVNDVVSHPNEIGDNDDLINDNQAEIRNQPLEFNFSDTMETKDVTEDEFKEIDIKSELLLWHYRLGHTPFSQLKKMAQEDILPKRLANSQTPKCPACLFGKATRRPWRGKTSFNQIGSRYKIDKPGQCLSVDQLESPTPGLIAQVKGIPTIARYNCATIFVDHLHYQRRLRAEETVDARSHNVKIQRYQADNGRFADN